ncbi:MAG: DUF1647 domain-containing protein [Anaerolineales bacterium]|nr:DUF1647 domain-containing protein [Anaerolineales bacterium]
MHRIRRSVEFGWKSWFLSGTAPRDPFVLVTGADRTHFKSLCNLLRSAARWEPAMRWIAYDLGLEEAQRREFAAEFPAGELRPFDYSKYPAYFDIRVNAGEFAWKPVIFHEVFREVRGSVCWFDAGNIVTGPLTLLKKTVQRFGFYAPYAKNTIAAWTHPKTLEWLRVEESIRSRRPLAGGSVGANWRFGKVREFVSKWEECALVKDCIAPAGSNRYNHRQDLSVLSILAYRLGLSMFMSSFHLGFLFQQDADE